MGTILQLVSAPSNPPSKMTLANGDLTKKFELIAFIPMGENFAAGQNCVAFL